MGKERGKEHREGTIKIFTIWKKTIFFKNKNKGPAGDGSVVNVSAKQEWKWEFGSSEPI